MHTEFENPEVQNGAGEISGDKNISACDSSISLDSQLSKASLSARKSIIMSIDNRKAKKIHLYRNGDRFFSGIPYAFLLEKTKTMEALLEDFTRILADKTNLPFGVRYIFTLDGKEKLTSVLQIKEGQSYVCSSFDNYVKLDYDKTTTPSWTFKRKYVDHNYPKSDWRVIESKKDFDLKEYIRPKIISVFRNGPKPRSTIKMVLNKKTAHSYEQVLSEIAKLIQLNTGTIRSIYTITGKQVKSLVDFFKDESIFIAYGLERPYPTDFEIDNDEYKILGIPAPFDAVKAKKTSSIISRTRVSSAASNRSLSPVRGGKDISAPKSPYCKQRKQINASKKKNKIPLPSAISLKYSLGRKLGDGNFAVVYECTDCFTTDKYALKIINKNKCKGKEDLIASEIAILRKVKHPNIIQLIEDFDIGLEIYLVMELVDNGDLFDAISSANKYSERVASLMMRDLAEALFYLHSLNIAHRDVKPENILVANTTEYGKMHLKLGDFGLAVEVSEPLYTMCGSPTYVAPEIISEIGYGVKVDVWASGVITYILLCGYPPFVSTTDSEESLFCNILSGVLEFSSPYWNTISSLAKEFVSGLLKVDPKARFSAEELLRHRWLDATNNPDTDLQASVASKVGALKEKTSSTSTSVAAKATIVKESKHFKPVPMGGDMR